jgi:hypothetical protein
LSIQFQQIENEGKTVGQIDCVKVQKNVKLLPPALVTAVTKRSGTWKVLLELPNAMAV